MTSLSMYLTQVRGAHAQLLSGFKPETSIHCCLICCLICGAGCGQKCRANCVAGCCAWRLSATTSNERAVPTVAFLNRA